MNTSLISVVSAALGSNPDTADTGMCTIPGGSWNSIGGLVSPGRSKICSIWGLAKTPSMKLCQIGPAPRDPAIFAIVALSLLPTQTPTTRSGV